MKVTPSAIADYLAGEGLTVGVHVPPGIAGAEITDLKSDSDASEGEAAWISASTMSAAPHRIRTFKGSLLVTPPLQQLPQVPHAIVACAKPKLAFSRLIARFFQDRLTDRWPEQGRQISEGALVDESAVIAAGALIGSGSRIGPRVRVGPNTVIANTTIAADVRIGANCTIGLPGFGYERSDDGEYVRFPHVGRVDIGAGVEIGSNTCIDRGTLGSTVIGPGVKIDNLVHVAHNVTIGANSLVIAHAMLGGSVQIGADVWCAPSVAIKNKLSIGANALIGMGAVVLKDVVSGETVVGNPARPLERRKT